jgi:hypothetical protein
MTRPRLLIGLAIPIALALAIALVLATSRDNTSPPTPTVAASTTPLTTQQPVDQWLTIVRQIMEYRHSLYTNPNPALLGRIYQKRCPCYEQEQKALIELQQRGWRHNDKGIEVLRTKLLGRGVNKTPPVVAIEVIGRGYPQVVVDGAGKVVKKEPGFSSTRFIYELTQESDRQWRVSLIIKD